MESPRRLETKPRDGSQRKNQKKPNDEGTVERKVRGQLIYEGIHRPILEKFLFSAENQVTDEDDFFIYRKLTNAFLTHLVGRLNIVTHQIFDLEFGRNEPSSNHAVFDMWHSTVNESDYFLLIDKYPALKELIETMVQQELSNLILASRAFHLDYSRLIAADLLPVQSLAEITHIFVLTGESHEGGKNVVLFYVNGTPMLALKPRNVQIEAKTSEFVRTRVAQWLDDNDWVFPKYLTSDAWGWTSWHVPQSCSQLRDVSRYFIRVGMFSAFSAVLGITDLNAENVIVRGASPIFVDLETVFHHQLNNYGVRWGVLSTGLFPTSLKYWGGKDLAESAGLMETLQPPEGDDGVRAPSQEKAYVFLGNAIQSPADFANEIVDGFKRAALQILRNRADVVSFIDSCKNLTTRCILRPTAGYQTIIEQSYHPSLLCNNGKRADYIEKCLDYAQGDLGNPVLIQGELFACIAGDVPRFESTPTAPYVKSSYQAENISLDNVATGNDKSCVYLEALTSTVIESEASEILEFLSQLKLIADSEIHIKTTDRKPRTDRYGLDRMLRSLAERVADQNLTMHTFRKTSYVGYMYEPLKIDLFSGLSGLAYFVQIYRDTVNDEERRRFANGFAQRLGKAAAKNQLVGGAYVGLCSAVLPFLALRSAVDPELFSHTVERLRTRIAVSFRDRASFLGTDLVGGLSGALAVCTLTWTITADARWLEIADCLYQTLLDDSKLDGNVRYFPSAPEFLNIRLVPSAGSRMDRLALRTLCPFTAAVPRNVAPQLPVS